MPSSPFFRKQSGVTDSVGPFRVWSAGVTSIAAVRRDMREASVCSSLRRSLESCFFFKRQGTGRKPLRKGKLYPLLLVLCVVLRGHSLDCTLTMKDHRYSCVSSWKPQRIIRAKNDDHIGVLLRVLNGFIPHFEGPQIVNPHVVC